MSEKKQRRPKSSASRPEPEDGVWPETASLTSEVMMRGRRRARELMEPAMAEAAARPPRSTRRSLIPKGSRRDLLLAAVWVAIFVGCFLLVQWSDG